MADKIVSELKRRFELAQGRRATYENQWDELSRYLIPQRGRFTGVNTPGEKINTQLFDGTAPWALEMFASGLQGFLTNPSTRWFQLETDVPGLMQNRDVSQWLEWVEDAIYRELADPRAKFYPQMHQLYLDVGAFGTGVLYIESYEQRATFRTYHLSECWIEENENGIVDTVWRRCDMQVRNIAAKFGTENLHPEMVKALEKDPSKTYRVIHLVQPNVNYDPLYFMFGSKKRFASVYFCPEHDHVLSRGGYDEMPYLVPRWYTRAGEVYGIGPGQAVLSDVKMVNEMAKTTLKAAQKIVDPPLMTPDDGFISKINMAPGALNYYRRGMLTSDDKITPVVTGGRIDISLEMINQYRQHIVRAFFVDQLNENKKAEMSATESMIRSEDRMRNMSPQLGRFHVECLQLAMERVFGILLRRGEIPALPQELQGRRISMRYVSPLARAQKTMQIGNMGRIIEAISPMAAVRPEIWENIDPDGYARWIFDLMDGPAQVLLPPEQVQEARGNREQMQQLAGMAQIAEQGSAAVKNITPLIQPQQKASA